MKLISLLDHLAATPATSAAAPRRDVLAQLGRAAVAALPLALGALPAAAATKDTALDACCNCCSSSACRPPSIPRAWPRPA